MDSMLKIKFKWISYTWQLLFLFLFYFITAKFGLSLNAVNHFATLVWIPSGIAVATLFLFGFRYWPGIFLGALLINIQTGAPILVALGIGIGNTLEAVCGAYLLKRLRLHKTFDSVSDVLKLILITPLSALVSATFGVASLWIGGTVTLPSFYQTWLAWWVGDMISIFIITPFILVWSTKPRKVLPSQQLVEAIFLALFTLLIGLVAFKGIFGISSKYTSITYIAFLPLIWAGLRFGQRGTTTTVLALSIFAVIETIWGFSSFTTGTLSQQLLFLQSFMGIITITSLILTSVETEKKNFEQRKDEFISLTSHELKNSLTSIKACTQMVQTLLEKRQDKKAYRFLHIADDQVTNLERLINDLLDISKIQAGKLDFYKVRINLLDVIYYSIETMQTTTTTHTIIINNKIKQNSLMVFADKDRIMQVITNLISNAIKYSPNKKKIIVTIAAHKKEAIVQVKDQGIGLTLQQQEKLFQRYYRAHTTDKHSFPGLGIGLYISRKIIKNHHGKIWVESIEGEGSIFSFSLPLENK